MAYFVACRKTIGATRIAYLSFREIVRMHKVSRSITSDQDTTFMSHFLKSLWENMGTKLNFKSDYHPKRMAKLGGELKVENLLRSLVEISRSNETWLYRRQSLLTIGPRTERLNRTILRSCMGRICQEYSIWHSFPYW